jgi:hypothetical protein
MSPLSIRLCILEVLHGVRPFALPQATLLSDVNHRVRPALTLGELVKHLSWLQRQQMVAFIVDDLDPENADARKWLIKEAGIAALNA